MRNQTYDSNGPDVRIRGNAYQVHEKYLALARDATAAGDRISAENYMQHAEHYFRIISQINDMNGTAEGQRRGRADGNGHANSGHPNSGHAGNGHASVRDPGNGQTNQGHATSGQPGNGQPNGYNGRLDEDAALREEAEANGTMPGAPQPLIA